MSSETDGLPPEFLREHPPAESPLGSRLRKELTYRASLRRRQEGHRRLIAWERQHPRACDGCGASPCGHTWHEHCDLDGNPLPSEKCCEACTHQPMPDWEHTHTIYLGKHPHQVMAVTLQAGDRVYFRADGVVEFVEQLDPDGAPRFAWLGRDVQKLASYPACLPEHDEYNQALARKPLKPWGDRERQPAAFRFLGQHPYDEPEPE